MRLAATRSSISAGSAVGDCAAADTAVMTSPNSTAKTLHIDACSPPGDYTVDRPETPSGAWTLTNPASNDFDKSPVQPVILGARQEERANSAGFEHTA